jgi:hypothetical protein
MAQTWTRRQLLSRAGGAAAGLAGLGLAGCGTKVLARPAAAQAKAAGAPRAAGTQSFVSRPDLHPPVVTITRRAAAAGDPAHIFLAAPKSGPGHGGAMILDRGGDLVWFSPDTAGTKMDFRPQTYRGDPVLTYFEGLVNAAGYGEGTAILADRSYRPIRTIKAAGGLQVDLHEFFLTPQNTALITAYRTRAADLSAFGGPKHGQVLSGVVQEIDVATGKLVFEWDSLDHIDVTDTYQKFAGGTAASPFDYFHINSIAVAPDGDLIVSSRNTWAVYKIARPGGKVVWRLNGKKSSFEMGTGTNFYWQHHARPHSATTLSLFDDGAAPAQERQSRAIVLDLDTRKMQAALRRQYTHPGKTLLATAMGSAQLLPSGRMFVGWGTEPYFSEFAPDGTLLLDGAITTGDVSYRAFTADWDGRPDESPAVAVRRRSGGGATVYMSWNGATNVAAWTILAGTSRSSLKAVGSAARSGFETSAVVTAAGSYFAAEPRDASGRVLARSAAVRAT